MEGFEIMRRIRENRLLDRDYDIMADVRVGGLVCEKYKPILYKLDPDALIDLTLNCVDLLRTKYEVRDITYSMLMSILIQKIWLLHEGCTMSF
jgi:hypothetical protein